MTISQLFIDVCRAVTADGKLVEEEVWYLANWLNEHPEAMKVWPGELFVGPLNEAFSDGRISADELQQINELILDIERAQSDKTRNVEPELEPEPPGRYRISGMQLAPIAYQAQIISSSGQDAYSVNLLDFSCTCPDWFDRRQRFEVDSINRICKHVAAALQNFETQNPGTLPQWLLGLSADCVGRGRGVFTNRSWAILQVGEVWRIISYGDCEWCNVYSRNQQEWSRFGYNLRERRWAYGESPKGARTIRNALHELCGA